MTTEELKALLEKAVSDVETQKTKNNALAEEMTKLTVKFESLKGSDQSEAMQLKMNELLDEISDLRAKVKTPVLAVSDVDQKNALKTVAVKSYNAFFRQGKNGNLDLKDFINTEVKSLNITNPTEGAESVASILSMDLIEYGREFSPILQLVGTKNGITRDYTELVLASYPAVADGIENVAGLDLPPTAAQTYNKVKADTIKIQAFPQITDEALMGTDYNVYGDLIRLLGDQIGVSLALKVLVGDGTAKNGRGLISSSRLDITNATGESWKPTLGAGSRDPDYYPAISSGVSGALGADDEAIVNLLIDVTNTLPTKYLGGAGFVMNRKTKGVIEKVRNTQGDPVFLTSYLVDGRPTILGFPVIIDDTLPDIAVDSTPIIFGDLGRAFAIANGDIDYMQLNPYRISGVTIVEYHKEIFTIMQSSDAILMVSATVNAGA